MTAMIDEKVVQTHILLEKLWRMQVDKESVIEIDQDSMQPPINTTIENREGARADVCPDTGKNASGLHRTHSEDIFKINEEEYNGD
jgi:hypothetical protein